MKKIIAFAGSNSSRSINQQLVDYVAAKLNHVEVVSLYLTDFDIPLFSEDVERDNGYPKGLQRLLNDLQTANALLISVNEHNGTVSAFFKNIIDWLSRIEYKFLEGKTVFLMSTSPGKRGGLSALEYTKGVLPRFGATDITTFRLPSFNEHFKQGDISDMSLYNELSERLSIFNSKL